MDGGQERSYGGSPPQPGEQLGPIPVLWAVALITGVSEGPLLKGLYKRITTLPVLPASKIS
jgi:hypothetical protein